MKSIKERMKFNFRIFLLAKGFESKKYEDGLETFEKNTEVDSANKRFYCICIHANGLMTSAKNNAKTFETESQLYNEDAELPTSKDDAEKFLEEFLK